jgi:hypothetical protein
MENNISEDLLIMTKTQMNFCDYFLLSELNMNNKKLIKDCDLSMTDYINRMSGQNSRQMIDGSIKRFLCVMTVNSEAMSPIIFVQAEKLIRNPKVCL